MLRVQVTFCQPKYSNPLQDARSKTKSDISGNGDVPISDKMGYLFPLQWESHGTSGNWHELLSSTNKGKGSPYSTAERRVPELIPVLCSQPAGDVSHIPGGRLPLLSARSAVTPATLKRDATNFAAWWTEARWVWTVCLRLLPDSVAAAIWTHALLRLSPAR